MSEITKPIDALPVVAKIQNIETEVLSCEIQNREVPLLASMEFKDRMRP